MNKWLNPIVLENSTVRLEPLTLTHCDDLMEATKDGRLWELWYTSVPEPEAVEEYIFQALKEYAEDRSLPFAVIDPKTGKAIGSTRYMNAESQNNRLEIGTTWYAQSHQRTGINTASKLLLLQHAFETLECIAVEFRTHWHNLPSRNAIARLGAKQDGILRQHQWDRKGNLRDTVVFSILDHEWKAVKTDLEFKLNR